MSGKEDNNTKMEAINNFIFYLNILKSKAVVNKANFNETNNYRKMISIYSLTQIEETIMKMLWKNGYSIFSREKIIKIIKDNGEELPDITAILKNLVRKCFLFKSWYIDNTKPLLRRFEIMYTVLVPYELYNSKLDEVIDVIKKDTNFLYVGIIKESLDENQIERIRRICNGEELDQ